MASTSPFYAARLVRAADVQAGDGLVGGGHFPGDAPRPYLVTKAVRHGNDRSLRRIEVGWKQIVVRNDELLIVQRAE